MTMRYYVGKVTRGRGKRGAQMRVEVAEGAWRSEYLVHSAGKTPEQIEAEAERWRAHHAKKVARLEGFRAVEADEWTERGQRFRVSCVTIVSDQPMVDLYVSVRRVKRARTSDPFDRGFEDRIGLRKTLRFATIDEVPSDEEIVQMAKSWAAEFVRDEEEEVALKRRFEA
jgi:hypothetical protein